MSVGVDTNKTAPASDVDTTLVESELLDVTDPAIGIYEHMPLFDIYLGNFSTRVSTALGDYIRYPVELVAQTPGIGKYDPISANENQPIFDRLFRFPMLNGLVAIVVPQGLVFRLVDIFFGGSGEVEDEQAERSLSGTEDSMLDKISLEIISALKALLQSTTSLKEISEIETWSHQKAARSGRTESMVTVKFSLALGTYDATLELWFSLSVLELMLGVKLLPGNDGTVHDPQWTNALKKQVSDCQLELTCNLVDQIVPLKSVVDFEEGDFVPLGDVSEAIFSIEKLPLFRARVGVTSEHASASFIEWI